MPAQVCTCVLKHLKSWGGGGSLLLAANGKDGGEALGAPANQISIKAEEGKSTSEKVLARTFSTLALD